MSKHTRFILTPISSILKDAIVSCKGVGDTIETYPLHDYVMQTVFLKMTGFQEQKMKCICWDIATHDFEFRYEFMKSSLGECSSYSDKNAVYKNLVNQIKRKHGLDSTVLEGFISESIEKSRSELEDLFADTNLLVWARRDYLHYCSYADRVYTECKLQASKHGGNLFMNRASCSNKNNQCKCLKDVYDMLYKHRNRCAHNLLSYQQNLPTLKSLCDKDNVYNNHFTRFFTLILIDNIFIRTYQYYLNHMESDI